jgi:hypothetical protein
MTADEPPLRDLMEAARPDCPDSLRRVLTKVVSTLELHDQRLSRIEETPEIKGLLP